MTCSRAHVVLSRPIDDGKVLQPSSMFYGRLQLPITPTPPYCVYFSHLTHPLLGIVISKAFIIQPIASYEVSYVTSIIYVHS